MTAKQWLRQRIKRLAAELKRSKANLRKLEKMHAVKEGTSK